VKESVNKSWLILFASMLVTFVLGSVHAFSVFIVPLENLLQLPRSEISLIYSFTLVSITVSVLFGYRIYSLVAAWLLVFLTCMLAATGLLVAAYAKDWWSLFIGYSLMFGISNGIGYGFTLQLAGRELPDIKGFSMGAVTAAYAVGSIVFAKIFASQITTTSIGAALTVLAIALTACAIVAGLLMWFSKANYGSDDDVEASVNAPLPVRVVVLFWLAYMLSVFAGLMAIGHAAGIAVSKGASLQLSVWSAMMIGVGSAGGGFLAGWGVDRWPITRFLIGLPLLSTVSLLSLSLIESPALVAALLSLVGFSYGAIIAVYPVAISNYFGDQGAKVYGRVFTAWGFAGLVAPWTAGYIYDAFSGYNVALIIASITALLSAVTVKLSRFER
jgi:OFA family oxalate/formate antiporter-like MFS transporter